MKKFILSFLILLTFFLIYKHYKINLSSAYFYDEYAWVGRAFYVELLLKGDFGNELWQTYRFDEDPKISSYLYGLMLYPDYLEVKSNKSGDYDMVRYLIDNNIYERRFIKPNLRDKYDKYRENIQFIDWKAKDANNNSFIQLRDKYGEGFMKTVDLIFKARTLAIFFLSLSTVLVFLISFYGLRSYLLSILTAVLYGVSALVYDYGSVAYTESLFLFFVYLSILVLIKISLIKKTKVNAYILLGVTIGLANQTKLNGIILLYILVLTGILSLVRNGFKGVFKIVKVIILVAYVSTAIYIVVDPYLYSNPIKNIFFQYNWTYEVSKFQQSSKWVNESLNTIEDRLVFTGQYFFDGNNRGLRPFFINKLPENYTGIIKILFFIGLFKSLFCLIKIKKISADNIIVTAFIGFYTTMMFYLMLSWERYLIHLTFFIFYFSAQGVKLIYDALYILAIKQVK